MRTVCQTIRGKKDWTKAEGTKRGSGGRGVD